MPDKNFTIENGESIEITVARKTGGRDIFVREDKKKGIIHATRKSDYLPRRKKAGNFIKFYDLGRIKIEGLWKDLNFVLPFEKLPGETGYDTALPTANASDAETYRDDQIFAYDKENWKNIFYKIEKDFIASAYTENENGENFSSRYKIVITTFTSGGDESSIDLGDSGKWTTGGLKLSAAELENGFLINSYDNLYFSEYIPIGTLGYYSDFFKITAVRNFEADSVSFSPSTVMEIYLMPNLVTSFGRSITDKTVLLNYFITNHSREQFLIHHRESDSQFVFRNGVYYGEPESAVKLRTVAYFKNIYGNRSFVDITNEDESHTTYTGTGAEFADTITASAEFVNNEAQGNYTSPDYTGILHAVIKQGDNWFYIWNA